MKSFILCLLVVSGIPTFAQWGEEPMSDKPSFKDRVFVGGGLGGSFGTTVDYISVSPIIGYKLNERIAPGISFMYRYTNNKYYTPHVSTTDYGISPFVRATVYGPFFAQVEYEYLNYEYLLSPSESQRLGFSSVLAGGGIFQPFGRHAGLYATALYNFSYQNTGIYPYPSPLIFRVGITAGF